VSAIGLSLLPLSRPRSFCFPQFYESRKFYETPDNVGPVRGTSWNQPGRDQLDSLALFIE